MNDGNKSKTKVDELLEAGELTEGRAEELAEHVSPDGGGTWPDIGLVLRVAEHDIVQRPLSRGELPEVLERALSESLQALLPMLGVRAVGSTYKLVEHARRQLDSERRKYELVCDEVGDSSRERTVRILGNYLETAPAPLFVSRLRRRFPKLITAAEDSAVDDASYEEWTDNQRLVDALLEPVDSDVSTREIAEWLDGLAREFDPGEVVLRAALDSAESDVRAVGAALAARLGEQRLAPTLLGGATRGAAPADLFAVAAARLAPLMARNVFGQFLAEASWGNPEEPEAELTDARSRAILVARCVLPLVGSPLEPIDEVDLDEHVDVPGLDKVPARIIARWKRWERLETIDTEAS